MKATIKRIFGRTILSIAIAGLTLAASAQNTTTWVGTAGDNEWTNGLNWDAGFPPDNATTTNNAIIPSGFPAVNYDQPMVAAGFGTLLLNETLNVSTNGFNCAGIFMTNTALNAGKLFETTGGAINITGNLTFSSNSVVSLGANSSLIVSGSILIGAGTNGSGTGGGTAGSIGFMTNNGAFISASTTSVNPAGASATSVFFINGGTNNLGNVTVKRSSPSSQPGLGTEGLIISNGIVNMTSFNVGGNGNSFTTAFMPGGVVTNTGTFVIQESTSARNARFLQTGGTFVNVEPNVINPDPPASGDISILSITGGTNITGGLSFGAIAGTAGTVNFTNSANVYIGAEGIVSNGAVTLNCILNSGGMFGATADWTGTAGMSLNGGIFTFQAAGPDNVAHNITMNGVLRGGGTLLKTGNGILTLNAGNTYSGNTLVNAGTLTIGATGTLASPSIFVASGATVDGTAVTGGYVVNNAKTVQGFGTVLGALNIASGGIVNPGSNAVTGTLTVGGLVENGGAVNNFFLSGSPSGPGNDFLVVNGDVDVTNSNNIQITGSVPGGSVYPLIQYSGNFNGATNNFAVVGATAVISNNATSKTLYLVTATPLRSPTNIVWTGNAANNVWNTTTSSNWLNNGNRDFFVPGDNVLFSNLGGTNPLVQIPAGVNPGSTTVSTTSNYTFYGNGNIGGPGGILVSNSGTLTVMTTNVYSGPTILTGGVLAATNLDISGSPSSIGAGSSDPGNLIMSGGTLRYLAPTAALTDHGMNLTNAGGTIDIVGGAPLTLSGSLVGPSGLTVTDGTLILTGAGNSYAGITTVASGGNLQLNNANGASTNTITLNNGTLTYSPSAGITVANAFNFTGTTNMIVVTSGAGGNNPLANGVWSGSGVLLISNTFSPYTVNASLDSFTGTILLVTPTTGGQFRFNSGGGNSMLGSSNALFDLGTGTGQLVCRNAGTMNVGGLQGGSGAVLKGPTAGTGTANWSIGNNNQNTTFAGSIQDNAANETSSIRKVGTGTLTLTGANTFSGAAIVTSGTLEVDGFNSGIGTTLVAGTLQGGGAVNGPVDIQGGGTLVPGIGGVGQLGASNTLTLESGCTNFFIVNAATGTNTAVVGMTSTGYGGNLIVSNAAGTFVAGQKFIIFGGNLNTFGGTFDSMILPTLPAPLSWDTSGLLVDGSITVKAPLSFTSISRQSGNLIMNGIGGVGSGAFDLLSSSNLLVPLSNWTLVNSYFFNPDGSFNVTNPVTPGVTRQFYMIQEQVGP